MNADGYFDDEGPGEHDAHLLDRPGVEDNDYVPCPNCGDEILAYADRCHHCGTELAGEAWTVEPRHTRAWWLAVAVAALMAFVIVWVF